MSRLRQILISLAAVAALRGPAATASPPAGLEFVGVAESSSGSLVALRDGAEMPARWARVGARFGDYEIVRYDSAAEVVVLANGSSTVRIALRTSKVADGFAAAGIWSAPALQRNLRLLVQAACQHIWETGSAEVSAADFVGAGRSLHRIESVSREDYAGLRFRLRIDGAVEVTDERGAAVPVALPERGVIAVTVGTTLAEVARRLGQSEGRLTELNPDFAREPPPGSPLLVQLW